MLETSIFHHPAAARSGPRGLTRHRRWLSLVVGGLIAVGAIFPSDGAESADVSGIVSRIRREPVQSRALAAVGYSKRLRALEVEFKRGGTYRYLDVPPAVYHQLLAADSKAGFYNRHVRGKYRSVYVRPRRER